MVLAQGLLGRGLGMPTKGTSPRRKGVEEDLGIDVFFIHARQRSMVQSETCRI